MSSETCSCSRRLFLLGSATSVAGVFLAACGTKASAEIAATEVPVGSAVFVGQLIIAQPSEGNFVAYSRTCPHQAQAIDQIHGDKVQCSAHSSMFNIADGSVVSGPAPAPLTKGTAEVNDGMVVGKV